MKSTRKRWYYVGSTNRLEERLKEHNKGLVRSTKYFTPLELVFIKKFVVEKVAKAYERKLKDRRREKEAIIKKIENRS